METTAIRVEPAIKHDVKGKGKASDIDYVLQLQLNFQEEDARLREDLLHLQTFESQEQFDCIICMETIPIDDVARVDACRHKFCRECMRNYVSSKLEDRKYPIMCPVCSTQNTPGVIGSKQFLL